MKSGGLRKRLEDRGAKVASVVLRVWAECGVRNIALLHR